MGRETTQRTEQLKGVTQVGQRKDDVVVFVDKAIAPVDRDQQRLVVQNVVETYRALMRTGGSNIGTTPMRRSLVESALQDLTMPKGGIFIDKTVKPKGRISVIKGMSRRYAAAKKLERAKVVKEAKKLHAASMPAEGKKQRPVTARSIENELVDVIIRGKRIGADALIGATFRALEKAGVWQCVETAPTRNILEQVLRVMRDGLKAMPDTPDVAVLRRGYAEAHDAYVDCKFGPTFTPTMPPGSASPEDLARWDRELGF